MRRRYRRKVPPVSSPHEETAVTTDQTRDSRHFGVRDPMRNEPEKVRVTDVPGLVERVT
jgi:hypothetical protein